MSCYYNLQVKTSYVSPINLQVFPENGYLPIFIVRNISNSPLIGQYSGTAVHFRCLAPSSDLLRLKRNGIIGREDFEKRYIIEMSGVNFPDVIGRLNYLMKISDARGIILMGYGADDKECHRSILRDLLNDSGLIGERVTELII